MGVDEIAFEGLVVAVVLVGVIRLRAIGGPDLVRRRLPWIAVFVVCTVPFPLVLRAIETGSGRRGLLLLSLALSVGSLWRGWTWAGGRSLATRPWGWLIVAGSAIAIVITVVAVVTLPAD